MTFPKGITLNRLMAILAGLLIIAVVLMSSTDNPVKIISIGLVTLFAGILIMLMSAAVLVHRDGE